MDDRKILLLIFSVIIYCLYSVHMWFAKQSIADTQQNIIIDQKPVEPKTIEVEKVEIKTETIQELKKSIPLFMKNACSVLQVFTEKPPRVIRKNSNKGMQSDNNTLTVIGITVFLVILVLNAILDVIKVKEEERAMRKLNPNGERRKSLAEFANKKSLRRESSKFGLQLCQIAEKVFCSDKEKKERKETRKYTRGDSTNSYLSERNKPVENSGPSSINETASETKLLKRQSVAKLFGARPAPIVRRSSFPALPQNPDIQALMLGSRQNSFDSDDEDGKGRRVRIIRRY